LTIPPAVSVLVPACNAEATIRETLESVRRQTLEDFELIVIDDGSTDATMQVLEAVADPRFRGFSYPNAGLAVARNRGLGKARGEFVSFIDADDLWTPDKLEAQVAALRGDPGAGAAYSWTIFLDEAGTYLFAKEPSYAEGDVEEDLRNEFFIASGSNVLLRRSCVEATGGFNPAFDPCSDWEYLLRFSGRWRLVVVPRYQILYRFSPGSMTSRIGDVERANRRLWHAAFEAFAPERPPRGRASLSNILQYECFLYLSRGPVQECRREAGRKLWSSIRTDPRTLLRLKTLKLGAAWLCLRMLPASRVRHVLRRLLRLQGTWAILRRPELRRLVRRMENRRSPISA
jgi:glycosyltransferase involved in cell wall biosynthesis